MPQILLNGVLTDLTDDQYDEIVNGSTKDNLKSRLKNKLQSEESRRIDALATQDQLIDLLARVCQIQNKDIVALKRTPQTPYVLTAGELKDMTDAKALQASIVDIQQRSKSIKQDINALTEKSDMKAFEIKDNPKWTN